MNNRKRELIEHLVRSIDYTKERILHWERLRTRESYDIFVRLNESELSMTTSETLENMTKT